MGDAKKTLEIVKKQSIGLDLVTLSGVRIIDMDLEVITNLMEDKNIEVEFDDVIGIKKIKIKTPMNEAFTYFYYNSNYSNLCRITIPVNGKDRVIRNINNSSCEELRKRIANEVIPSLKENYGISVSFDNAFFTTMEINCDLVLPENLCFTDFSQIISLILLNMENFRANDARLDYYKAPSIDDYAEEKMYETQAVIAKRCSGIRSLKIYNKTKEVSDASNKQLVIDKNIMRLELKLQKERMIRETFNFKHLDHVYLNALTDEMLEKVFIKNVISQMLNVIEDKILVNDAQRSMELFDKYNHGKRFSKIAKEVKLRSMQNESGFYYIHSLNYFIEVIMNDKKYKKNRNSNKMLNSMHASFEKEFDALIRSHNALNYLKNNFEVLLGMFPKHCIEQQIISITYNSFYYS